MPCWGKLALISRRMTASAARSASVTGSKSWATLLLSIDSEVRKNGRMVSPEEVASRPIKALKSMTVTAVLGHAVGGGGVRHSPSSNCASAHGAPRIFPPAARAFVSNHLRFGVDFPVAASITKLRFAAMVSIWQRPGCYGGAE